MHNLNRLFNMVFIASCVLCSADTLASDSSGKNVIKGDLPELPDMPEVPTALAVGSVPLGNSDDFEDMILDIPIADGPFAPTWESIEANYPGTPEWLRDAKFGIWVHFGPQSAGESGDWYARNLYKEDHHAYENHVKR